MNGAAGPSEVKNPKTGMTHPEMKEFIRNHFEEFVNRKNLRIGEVNFSPGFVARANVVASVLHSPFASCASWTGISSAKFSATHFSDLSSLPLYFSCPSLCA